MGRVKWLCIGILVSACGGASAQFPFRYYNLKANSYEGKLEGATDKDDLPFSTCAPSAGKQNKCTVLLSDSFTSLKVNYQKLVVENQKLRDDLSSCR